jgi:dihydroorotase
MYDILLKGGEVIDPSQAIHSKQDLAIQGDRIVALKQDIPETEATRILNVAGKIIVPGLIDIHCHPAAGLVKFGFSADEVGLSAGVTLLCDAGSSGAANFETMRRFIVEPARTDMFCFLNLSLTGLITVPEVRDRDDIDIDRSKEEVEANRNLIKGIKVRAIQSLAEGVGIKGIEVAKRLAVDLKLPLMMHVGERRDRVPDDTMDEFSRAAVSLLEKGDILSHYLTYEPGGMILMDGTVYPELEAARSRGVFLDSCHGNWHFSFAVARHGLAQGFIPSVISTDLASTTLPVVQSLPVVMSMFLNMGLNIDQVIEMTTTNPARALGEEGRRGSLKPGMRADLTVIELVHGDYLFGAGDGYERLHGEVLLEPRMVFRAGDMMPAYSRYHVPQLRT